MAGKKTSEYGWAVIFGAHALVLGAALLYRTFYYLLV